MVAHFMLRTYDVNKTFFRKKTRIWLLSRCNQMPSTNRNAWFTPCVRLVKWATIYYKSHEYDIILLNLFDNDIYHIWYEKIEKNILMKSIKTTLFVRSTAALYFYFRINKQSKIHWSIKTDEKLKSSRKYDEVNIKLFLQLYTMRVNNIRFYNYY